AGYGGIVGGGLFQDVRVRQAFAYCINREALVESLMYGRPEAKALPVYVPADHPLYDATDIATYEFDPDKGRALLNEAGWADGNGDGVLDKGGKKLGLIYNHGPTGNTLRQSLAQLLKTQLKEDCGIDLTPQELKRDDLFGSFPDGALFGRRFDLGQFAWVADGEPSCLLYTRREWTGAGDGKEDKYGITSGATEGANDVGYFNPAFDAACYKALESLDPDDRKYWHHEAMKIFSQDVPSLVLFVRLRIAVARPSVTGFVLDSTQDSELWNVEAMDVLTP
ncbi:MAG: ABC transporter substrate-binding protein, partial [Chloroflexota bacterium]